MSPPLFGVGLSRNFQFVGDSLTFHLPIFLRNVGIYDLPVFINFLLRHILFVVEIILLNLNVFDLVVHISSGLFIVFSWLFVATNLLKFWLLKCKIGFFQSFLGELIE
jgi:hypothetical protein